MRLVDYPIPLVRPQESFANVNLNSPITERRRIRAVSDRFVAGGVDTPLYGVNIGPDTMDHRPAFEFLASMGVNLIRVTVPFRVWAGNDTVVPNPAPVDLAANLFAALCRQQKICEDLGIYIMLRDLATGAGPPYFMPEDAEAGALYGRKDASLLGVWHPGIRKLVMERLRRLMRRQNPETRRPFGASPALMGIQITNEAGWFAADAHQNTSRQWRALQAAPDRIVAPLAEAGGSRASDFKRISPEERLRVLARANAAAQLEARNILQTELGNSRPLLVADNAPWAGGLAFEAFAPCDAYGWNLYPTLGGHSDVSSPVHRYDLTSERFLDRMQIRLVDKPTIITECGDKLASGGMSRLIADMTTRAAVYGYAGLTFHYIYNGNFGEHSVKPEWLASRTPRFNFNIGADPAALCVLQACSLVFRKKLIKPAARNARLSAERAEFAGTIVRRNRQVEDMTALVGDLNSQVRGQQRRFDTTILLSEGRAGLSINQGPSTGQQIEVGHARAPQAEIDWFSRPGDPEQDWLFIRATHSSNRNLLVLVGRSKPDPAQQKFQGGVATLEGLIRHPFPDPRTGYGSRNLVRRPVGPGVRIEGELRFVGETGRQGDAVRVSDRANTTLPLEGVRFMEVLSRPRLSLSLWPRISG